MSTRPPPGGMSPPRSSTKISRTKSTSEKVSTKRRDSIKKDFGSTRERSSAKSRKESGGDDTMSGGTPLIKTKSDKSIKSENSKSKSAKRRGRSKDYSRKVDGKKKKERKKGRTLFEKFALSLGFFVGHVTLTDPRAIEAAQALDLQPWHLRRLKQRFDRIDIDGSGNIDFDEFFESIGEIRSPFTDKLFALIGKQPPYRTLHIDTMHSPYFTL